MTEFKEVKTAELTGAALDWAVTGTGCLTIELNGLRFDRLHRPTVGGDFEIPYQPSTNWAQGGPLISRFLMDFSCDHPETIGASLCDENGMYLNDHMAYGPTHLIAACRALVAYKTGEWACIPKDLLP
jgi:hypothetical protein